jgi:hypothetical protein
MIYDERVVSFSLSFLDNVVWLQGTRILGIACLYLKGRVFDPEMVLKLLTNFA